ncbi:MAG: hypothetical protein LBR56_02105 [Sporomusaceae bacterium]|nr:hypothetical protein [Sporomusaceae bacterium]
MLKYNSAQCLDCAESNNCEFASDFCPRAAQELDLEDNLAADPVFQKYKAYYRRPNF